MGVGVIASTSTLMIKNLLQHLSAKLDSVVNPMPFYLGMEIEQISNGSLLMHQAQIARRVLQRFCMEDAHEAAIPMDQQQDLSLNEENSEDECVNVLYKEAIGSLLYLAIVVRPDIAYAVNSVS